MATSYCDRMKPNEAFKRGFYYGLGMMFAVIFMQILAIFGFFALASATGAMNKIRDDVRERYGVKQDADKEDDGPTSRRRSDR